MTSLAKRSRPHITAESRPLVVNGIDGSGPSPTDASNELQVVGSLASSSCHDLRPPTALHDTDCGFYFVAREHKLEHDLAGVRENRILSVCNRFEISGGASASVADISSSCSKVYGRPHHHRRLPPEQGAASRAASAICSAISRSEECLGFVSTSDHARFGSLSKPRTQGHVASAILVMSVGVGGHIAANHQRGEKADALKHR
jgi:hypothetical protein